MNSEEIIKKVDTQEVFDLDVKYAGLGIRILAYLLDGIILIPTILIFEYLLFGNLDSNENPLLRNFLNFSIWTIYYGLTESSKMQGTIGKKICGIMVIDKQGNRLNFKKASLRFIAQIISIIPLGFGIWAIASDEKKQAWHDMLMECFVIKNEKQKLEN